MARLNIEELVGGLLEAAMVSQGISERQHINALRNYFNEDGTPRTISFLIGDKNLVVPLYILADHSSMGLDELDIEFEARLIFGDDETEVSDLKKSLLGLFKKQGYEHNIRGIEVDSGKNNDTSGMAKIKVKFKSDQKPEAVSRLIDAYIQNMDNPGHTSSTNNIPNPVPPPAPIHDPAQDWIKEKGMQESKNEEEQVAPVNNPVNSYPLKPPSSDNLYHAE